MAIYYIQQIGFLHNGTELIKVPIGIKIYYINQISFLTKMCFQKKANTSKTKKLNILASEYA